MKKIHYITTLIIASLTINSCQDAYEIERHGFIDAATTDPYINMDNVRSGINSIYDHMDRSSQISLGSIWTDECGIGYANGGQGISDGTYSFQMSSGSDYASGIWYGDYGVINAVNRFLAAKDIYLENYASDSDIAEVDQLTANAKILRAYAYLDLISYFSPNPQDDGALGVMNMKDLTPELSNPVNLPRVSNGEIYAAIEADLQYAESFATVGTDPYFVDKNTATAIRARMSLMRGDYAGAITYAQDLIDQFPLTSRGIYRAMFFSNQKGESIFKLKRYKDQFAVARIWSSVGSGIDGSPFFEMGRSLFNLFSTDDIRYDVNLNAGSVIDPNYQNSSDFINTDILLIGKYKGTSDAPNDMIVFRVAEMYLIKAEAQAQLNMLSDAASTLQVLREGRYNTGTAPALPAYSNKTEALSDVLLERRKEFAFEGHRYVDLKRLGSQIGEGASRDPKDCESTGACYLEATSYKFTLPIPGIELGANPEIAGQQNPGY